MFPKISDKAVDLTVEEFVTGTEEARKDKLIFELDRVSEENPAIGDYLQRICMLDIFKSTPYLLLHSVGFGLQMYRILEEELRLRGATMPIVSPEIGAPLQEEFFRSLQKFLENEMRQLLDDSPRIGGVAMDWTFDFYIQDDFRSAQMVYTVGLAVYKFVKGQWDANELITDIGGKLR